MNSVLCAFVVAEAKVGVFHEGAYLHQVFKTGSVCTCVRVDRSLSTFFSHITTAVYMYGCDRELYNYKFYMP